MAILIFVIVLEVKREIIAGKLGGMLSPAAIYSWINQEPAGVQR
jgi:Na+/H+ antiporter NhaA